MRIRDRVEEATEVGLYRLWLPKHFVILRYIVIFYCKILSFILKFILLFISLQLYHVAYLIIKFANSPRPGVWILERSKDYGETYQAWQYFADTKGDCNRLFGMESLEQITRDDDVVCTDEYSSIVPLEDGEVRNLLSFKIERSS